LSGISISLWGGWRRWIERERSWRPKGCRGKIHMQGVCWRIKLVSTYDPQAYGPTPFSPWDSQGSCQSAEQGDY
jgi:hypothetical protein